MKLILIDDDKEITTVISKFCEIQEIPIDVFNDPLEGLEAIRKREYSLLLLDIAMPGISGTEILQKIHDEGFLEKLDVVIITASSAGKHSDLKEMGATKILRKPFSIDDLTEIFSKYL